MTSPNGSKLNAIIAWIKIIGSIAAFVGLIVVWYFSVETVKADVTDIEAFQEREVRDIHPSFVTREKLDDSLRPLKKDMRTIKREQAVIQEDVKEILRRLPR